MKHSKQMKIKRRGKREREEQQQPRNPPLLWPNSPPLAQLAFPGPYPFASRDDASCSSSPDAFPLSDPLTAAGRSPFPPSAASPQPPAFIPIPRSSRETLAFPFILSPRRQLLAYRLPLFSSSSPGQREIELASPPLYLVGRGYNRSGRTQPRRR